MISRIREPLSRVLFSTGLVLLLALMTGCGSLSGSGSGEPLRVGTSTTYPPLTFKKDGNVVGLEVDNARQMAEALGRPLELLEFPFEDLIPALEKGDIDVIMTGMTVTEDRALRVAFCEPNLVVGLGGLVRKGEAARYEEATDLRKAKARFGVGKDTTAHDYVSRQCYGRKGMVFIEASQAVQNLKRKRIDVYVDDAPTLRWISRGSKGELEYLTFGLLPQDLAWAVAPSNTRLLNGLNRKLKSWKRSGKLDETIEQWLPGWDNEKAAISGLRSALAFNIEPPKSAPGGKAEVFANGKLLGTVDLVAGKWRVFYVRPGEYALEIKAPGCETLTQDIVLEPYKNQWLEFKLKAPRAD